MTTNPHPTTITHIFAPAKDGESRSPCPALNSLANHGYLPHSGRNIGLFQLTNALREVYNLSFVFAFLLSLAAIVICGHRFCLDLNDLAVHGRLEHDASLVHVDALRGSEKAPVTVDPDLLRSLLSSSTAPHGLTLCDFARVRCAREETLEKPLNKIHSDISKGEAALAWLMMADEHGEAPVERLACWFGEERLPDGWKKPHDPIGLAKARGTRHRLAAMMEEVRSAAGKA